jgi:hypothetical protein
MSAQQVSQVDRDARIARLRCALRAVSALAYSEFSPDEALIGRRSDLSDLLDILGDELEAATAESGPAQASL